jgi:ankyrin repeat protein
MTRTLPERASLDWLRKTAKQSLDALKANNPDAKLADAQRELAREYGFRSWRALKAHVEAQSAPDEKVVAAFLLAVGEGKADAVRAALAAEPALANAVGPHPYWGGRPQALHVAIETKRRDIFDLLLEAGADVDGRNGEYDLWSPLMLTFSRETEEMRAELLKRGARIGLCEALLMRDDALVDKLLRKGLPDIAPNAGSILAFARTTHAIDRLLALGASIDRKDRWGSSPIDAMSRSGGEEGRELVRHMMMRGVVAKPQEFARLGDRDMLEMLMKSDPAIVKSDAVMMGAVDFGHHALVRWLAGQGANVNARSDAGSHHTALHSAAWNGDLEMVKLLVELGADIAARDEEHNGDPQGWAEVSVTVSNNPKCAEVAAWLAALPRPG